jgi:hypothetical protein
MSKTQHFVTIIEIGPIFKILNKLVWGQDLHYKDGLINCYSMIKLNNKRFARNNDNFRCFVII